MKSLPTRHFTANGSEPTPRCASAAPGSVSGKPEDRGVERCGQLGQTEPAVALWVDGHEDRLHPVCFVAQIIHDQFHLGQCRGADIGAIGTSEEHQRMLVRELCRGPSTPFAIRESKRRTECSFRHSCGRTVCNKKQYSIEQDGQTCCRSKNSLQPYQSHPIFNSNSWHPA